jgi:hypothetical protein
MRLASVVAVAVLGGLLVAPGAPPAYAADECAATPYPGDGASQSAIAVWMARGAQARGIPGELPVMAALVESGLVNLNYGDSDAKGYFQMRESIWGPSYPDFPEHPDLQLDWFLDQAALARTPPYPDETQWGEWAADVERPAEQYRYRYQLRLADARALIGAPCTAPDTVAPATTLAARARQRALRDRGLRVEVGCAAEECTAHVRARVLLGRRPRLSAPRQTLAPGQQATFRLRLPRSVRTLVAQALRHHQRVRVAVTARTTDLAGNTTVTTSRVRITG